MFWLVLHIMIIQYLNFCKVGFILLTTISVQCNCLIVTILVLSLLSFRLGCWQFIADMPFSNVSKATMWKLLWLLHQSHGKLVDVSSIPPVGKCIQFIQGTINPLFHNNAFWCL